jgi:tetratricopeptide (TPR) repeat protein
MYDRGRMRVLLAMLAAVTLSVAPAWAADPLAEARRLYNQGQLDMAVRYAREAVKVPATSEAGRLVLGRIQLERYRRSADVDDLSQARDALRAINPESLDARERAELAIGLGQCLFLEDRFGVASESFERVLEISPDLGPAAHERVLDWWATALHRLALSHPRELRDPFYARIVARMEKELAVAPTSAPAAYWLAAGFRGIGNLDRAWYAAGAGWVNAIFSRDRGAALRADLDRLVVVGIIPERSARLQPRAYKQTAAVMLAEWEALKASYTR